MWMQNSFDQRLVQQNGITLTLGLLNDVLATSVLGKVPDAKPLKPRGPGEEAGSRELDSASATLQRLQICPQIFNTYVLKFIKSQN